MSVVLVAGGSGTLGQRLVPRLEAAGHQVRVLSRRPGRGTHVGDLATGAGLAEAADGAELVVHAASDRRMGRTDLVQTEHLLDAVRGCRHLLYVSIVGVDVVPFLSYRRKLACEETVAASPVPSTTFRATQFHELAALVLGALSRAPLAPLPALPFQPVAADEVAVRVVELLAGQPLRRAPDMGGPEVLWAPAMAELYWTRHRRPPAVLSLRLPGATFAAMAEGRHTCPDHADGRQTWAEFVAAGG